MEVLFALIFFFKGLAMLCIGLCRLYNIFGHEFKVLKPLKVWIWVHTSYINKIIYMEFE